MLGFVVALLLLGQEVPVEFPLPPVAQPLKLIRAADGKEIPYQRAGDRVVFLAKNEKSDYRLETGVPSAVPPMECLLDARTLTIRAGTKTVLVYHYGVVEQPDPLFSRSGYLHPIFTPSGKTVSNDSPPNHLHHHGIWSAWTSSEFEGRKSNFWESKEKQGRVECVKIGELRGGPVFAGFQATHRFINLNGPDGPKTALNETWEIRVYALTDRFVFDLVSTQTCATDAPLVIKEYRYGGIGFRGAPEWEGKAGVSFLTSEGKDRIAGHATKARWVAATGKIGDSEASIGFLGHPDNFRAPQPLRIHPDEPFFNWAVPRGGDFKIEPGHPYVARYRFIVSDGRLGKDEMDAAWSAYAEAPKPNLAPPK